MLSLYIQIKFIPLNIKTQTISSFNYKLRIVGYRKYNNTKKLVIIEFRDKTRIWLLLNEIKNIGHIK